MPVTPVRWPISTKMPNSAIPTTLPAISTMSVSRSPSPSPMPSAPSTQLIGAMLAPAQIQNCPETRVVRTSSGIGCSTSSIW
jgi:hypothetical protein